MKVSVNFRIYSGSVRMPDMDVFHIKDVNLNVSDFESTKDIFFNIKGQC